MDLMGTDGFAFDPNSFVKKDWKTSWLNAASMRIAGGADEILLNTIAEKIFRFYPKIIGQIKTFHLMN